MKNFEELLQKELDKLPYTKHLDDGQYNDGKIAGFELGARWVLSLFAVRRSFKIDYKFGHLSKEGYRHFPIIYFAYGKNGFSVCILGATITVKLW